MDCCECWIAKYNKTQPLAAQPLASHVRASASVTLFFVWLLETVRTGENGLKRAIHAFQPLPPGNGRP